MIDFKECAKKDCTNEKHWNVHDYHKAEGVERLRICLCTSCHNSFEKRLLPTFMFSSYIDQRNATLKGK